jgi:phytol kinase
MLYLGSLAEPVRSRVPALAVGFAAIDRPEDRPHTLLWLSTQTLVTYVVLVGLIVVLGQMGKPELIFLPLIINGIGDGLAEPVGVRFGKHKYTVRALFTRERYTRSLEGSACVFVSALAALAFLAGSFTGAQLLLACLTIPLAATLVEALSPHTWDSPFIYAAVGGLTVAVLMV